MNAPAPTAAPTPGTAYGIGYERRSMQRLIEALAATGARQLWDVRATAWSRKPDARGDTVAAQCRAAGIGYRHAPGLGIASAERGFLHRGGHYHGRSLSTDDRARLDGLLNAYEERIRDEPEPMGRLELTLRTGASIGLLCYEADAKTCHRHRLQRVLHERTGCPIMELTEDGPIASPPGIITEDAHADT